MSRVTHRRLIDSWRREIEKGDRSRCVLRTLSHTPDDQDSSQPDLRICRRSGGWRLDCVGVTKSLLSRITMVNPRRAFPVVPGLVPVFDIVGRANIGHALETAVLVELERRRMNVTFVRTRDGYEVDFLARGPAGNSELIQVCADASETETLSRELRALAQPGQVPRRLGAAPKSCRSWARRRLAPAQQPSWLPRNRPARRRWRASRGRLLTRLDGEPQPRTDP
jgi:hypothetical protein